RLTWIACSEAARPNLSGHALCVVHHLFRFAAARMIVHPDQAECQRFCAPRVVNLPFRTFMKTPCDEISMRSLTAGAPCTAKAGPWILAATILASSMAFI